MEKRALGYLESYIKTHEVKGTPPLPKIDGFGLDFVDNQFDNDTYELDSPKQKYGENIPDSEIYNYDKTNDYIKPDKWHKKSVRDFLNSVPPYEDPTYLGYEIMILSDESPLFNYDTEDSTSYNSAYAFIEKYGDISEITNRKELLSRLLKELKEIFSISTNPNLSNSSRRHYIEMITGLNKLTSKIVNYEKDLIEITLTEDITLRTQYLVDLYNNLIYDYKNKRNMIPENLLRFNLLIKITDIRDFKDIKFDNNGDAREFFTDELKGGTYSLYKLHDCNFDFVNSQTHEDSISMAGFNKFNMGNMNNTKVNIKYKSISKILESSLINGNEITYINTHDLTSLDNGYNTNKVGKLLEHSDKAPKIYVKKPIIIDKHKQSPYLDILGENLKKGKKALLNKFDEIRGELIIDLTDEVRNRLPSKLGNVYSTTFRQLSIQNFATGLVNDLADKALNDITGAALDITNPFKGKDPNNDLGVIEK